jgi:hypothetical protein
VPPPAASVVAVSAEQLSDATGYLLEIVEPTPGKKGIVLRIQPDHSKQPEAAACALPSATPPPPRPRPVDDSLPPAWLRAFMEPEYGTDLLEPFPQLASRAGAESSVDATK